MNFHKESGYVAKDEDDKSDKDSLRSDEAGDAVKRSKKSKSRGDSETVPAASKRGKTVSDDEESQTDKRNKAAKPSKKGKSSGTDDAVPRKKKTKTSTPYIEEEKGDRSDGSENDVNPRKRLGPDSDTADAVSRKKKAKIATSDDEEEKQNCSDTDDTEKRKAALDLLKEIMCEYSFTESTAEEIRRLSTRPRKESYLVTSLPEGKRLNEGVYKHSGTDSRIKVKDAKIPPYSMIGLVVARFPQDKEGFMYGTGTLIGPDIVLTAAHVVYSDLHGGRATHVEFYPGVHGSMCQFPKQYTSGFYIAKNYPDNSDEDYALLVLRKPIGNEAGYMELEVEPPDLKKRVVRIAGYQDDKVADTDKYEQWEGEGPIEKIYKDRKAFSYWMDTCVGQSGGAVWCEKDGKYYVVGVHIQGDNERQENIALTITKERYAEISHWPGKAFEETTMDLALKEKGIDVKPGSSKKEKLKLLAENESCWVPSWDILQKATRDICDAAKGKHMDTMNKLIDICNPKEGGLIKGEKIAKKCECKEANQSNKSHFHFQ